MIIKSLTLVVCVTCNFICASQRNNINELVQKVEEARSCAANMSNEIGIMYTSLPMKEMLELDDRAAFETFSNELNLLGKSYGALASVLVSKAAYEQKLAQDQNSENKK